MYKETKFKVGDRVRIISHKDSDMVGKIGIITRVIPSAVKAVMSVDYNIYASKREPHTTAFYKLRGVENYGTDNDIELVK